MEERKRAVVSCDEWVLDGAGGGDHLCTPNMTNWWSIPQPNNGMMTRGQVMGRKEKKESGAATRRPKKQR